MNQNTVKDALMQLMDQVNKAQVVTDETTDSGSVQEAIFVALFGISQQLAISNKIQITELMVRWGGATPPVVW